MIDCKNFDSDISVDDPELAYELLDSTLGDEQASLLRSVGEAMQRAEDVVPAGESVAYCVLGLCNGEVESHVESAGIQNALAVYMEWLNKEVYGYDEVIMLRCSVKTPEHNPLDDSAYDESIADQCYDKYTSGCHELLASKSL